MCDFGRNFGGGRLLVGAAAAERVRVVALLLGGGNSSSVSSSDRMWVCVAEAVHHRHLHHRLVDRGWTSEREPSSPLLVQQQQSKDASERSTQARVEGQFRSAPPS